MFPGPNIPLREDRDLGVALQTHPGSQASSRGEAKDSALLSSRDADLLEPTEWPEGRQASSSVWREDSGLLSRPRRKRKPSSCDDWGVSSVFLSCSSSVGFLTGYDEELRETLVWRQGSQVSIPVVRGRASLILSHGRVISPQKTLKKDSQGLSWVATGNAGFPQLVPVTSASFSGCLWEVRDTVELGLEIPGMPLGFVQWKRDSSGVEGSTSRFLSISDSDSRVPAELGQESQASYCVEEWNSSCLSSCSRGDRPLVQLCVEPAGFSGRCTGCQ